MGSCEAACQERRPALGTAGPNPASQDVVLNVSKVASNSTVRTPGMGHEATFAPGQTGRSRTDFDRSRATHRATGARRINPPPPTLRWATSVTAWPAATKPR